MPNETTHPASFQSLKTWFRMWLALTIGSFLGYSVVPALFHKSRTGSDWSAAIDYGIQSLYERWVPTVIGFSVVVGIIVFIGWKKGKIR
ncbi:MAG: hypothetical protein Q4D85_07865 [Corynebacterium sp.]|uniref:hypothetical protein n=1 Tax=Corynebacterium sp. TaxID=1720 RepID=UPI0026DDC459|nr:hypothetical protein [Corynebacterium sp.]MDO5098661.1 hypothetical protein [Corynebacterium sp.]